MAENVASKTDEMKELGDEDVLDPHPDIHALFCYYNSLYFGDALSACSVDWSSSRMTSLFPFESCGDLKELIFSSRLDCVLHSGGEGPLYYNWRICHKCAGVCHCRQKDVCEIRLSEPLLKFRSTADLKNTLLHEMIHAFLWVENRNKDHSDHGSNFQRVMNDINGSSIDDYQRPAGGYNITVYHSFHAEVDSYQVHRWMCDSCGDIIKRAMNRAPSASDCIGRVKHEGSCGNPYCHWHQHKMHCSGNYVKIAEPPGYEGKSLKRKHKHQNDGLNELSHAPREKPAKRHQTVGHKDELDVNKGKTITRYFPIVDSRKLTVDNHSFADASQSHLHHNDAIILKIPKDMVLEKSSRGGGRCRRKQNCGGVATKHCGQGSDYTVMSTWFDWDVEEEEFCEDLEPLLNKRSERRKKHRALMTSKVKATEDYTLADLCPAVDNNIVLGENTDVVTHKHPLDPLDASARELEASDFCRGAGSVKAD